jgi:hypothetical protein
MYLTASAGVDAAFLTSGSGFNNPPIALNSVFVNGAITYGMIL